MRPTIAALCVAGACLGASGCIAVVKGDGGGESKSRSSASSASAPSTSAERGTVEPIANLERVPEGPAERVSADVRYVNDTGRTLKSVTIWCRARDAGGYELASDQVILMSGTVGPMEPGFKARRPVSFVQPPGVVASVSCEVTTAQ